MVVGSRACRQCGREFRPSSRHLRCPACRSRDECVCGNGKQVHSATCLACRDQSGQANSNWKGGKTYHKAGYVMVRAPDHPRSGRGSYVFEHILVMESIIGRHLAQDETVHHINGVRDDNRPENLEIWVRPQPSGVRASDAVIWAIEILARYAPTELQQRSRDTSALGGAGGRTRVR